MLLIVDAVLHRIETLPAVGGFAVTFRNHDGSEQAAVVQLSEGAVQVAEASLPRDWPRDSDMFTALVGGTGSGRPGTPALAPGPPAQRRPRRLGRRARQCGPRRGRRPRLHRARIDDRHRRPPRVRRLRCPRAARVARRPEGRVHAHARGHQPGTAADRHRHHHPPGADRGPRAAKVPGGRCPRCAGWDARQQRAVAARRPARQRAPAGAADARPVRRARRRGRVPARSTTS